MKHGCNVERKCNPERERETNTSAGHQKTFARQSSNIQETTNFKRQRRGNRRQLVKSQSKDNQEPRQKA